MQREREPDKRAEEETCESRDESEIEVGRDVERQKEIASSSNRSKVLERERKSWLARNSFSV